MDKEELEEKWDYDYEEDILSIVKSDFISHSARVGDVILD